MDTDVYFKKIYTVAFRLTGDKKTACELASQAILKFVGETDANNKISDFIFKSAAMEVCRLFLEKHDTCLDELNFDINIFNDSKDKVHEIQEVLLSLEPVNRIIIIWKDILGFQLYDLLSVTNTGRNELNAGLSHARMQIKQNVGRNLLF
ncbi:MAG: hypothetical protein WBJ13_05115 [Sedimentibacter sp.]